MKKVLILGSEGQLGFDSAQLFKNEYLVAQYNHREADITNWQNLNSIVSLEKPDFIINATAYNKVEVAETDSDTAFAVNAKGVENLVNVSKAVGAILVHVSTDYVFDGSKDFFVENDIPHPLNVYGKSKLDGEKYVQESGLNYYLIRTSSVFGAKPSSQKQNFVDKMISLAKAGQTLKVVDDQIMSPTYSLDLAFKIKELIAKPAPFGLYHITNQGSCSWYELAKKSLEIMQINATIEPINSKDSGSKVNRPKRSVLKNLALEQVGIKPMPLWQDALLRYLKEKYNV